MAIYYKDLIIKATFNNDIINEEFFKGIVAQLKIAIRIRDFREGRAGQVTRHKDSPSIKVISYGPGRSSNHSKDGDPVYFYSENNQIKISYDKNKFDKREIKYIENFIHHNYLNLSNYWFAPKYIKDINKLEEYQDNIKSRILLNIDNYDYGKEYQLDDEIKMY